MNEDERKFSEVMDAFVKAMEVFIAGQRAFAAGNMAAFKVAKECHAELVDIHRALAERYLSNQVMQ